MPASVWIKSTLAAAWNHRWCGPSAEKIWQSGFSNQTNVKEIKNKNIPLSSSLKCALHISISSLRHPLMLIYHPAEIIRLHARRGPWVPASTRRLQNHSEAPPKQSGTTGARPSPSVSRQQETWDHEGCWDCRRAATIYWHFMEAGREGARWEAFRRDTVRM